MTGVTPIPAALSPADLDTAWEDLAATDARKALRAQRLLAAHPEAALNLLAHRLKPALPLKREAVNQLILKLLDSDPSERNRARTTLLQLGQQVEPLLEEHRQNTNDDRLRAEVGDLLTELRTAPPTPEMLRHLRAVDFLARHASEGAVALLRNLAAGAPEALLTQEAKSALLRIQRCPG
jgi:hypothetical protein